MLEEKIELTEFALNEMRLKDEQKIFLLGIIKGFRLANHAEISNKNPNEKPA